MSRSAAYRAGTASFSVKGSDQAELSGARADAGVPAELARLGPEAGAWIDITYTHDRAVPGGFNPAKMKRITYTRPGGAVQATPPEVVTQQTQASPPWAPNEQPAQPAPLPPAQYAP